jgi:hypothetical protein
MITLEHELECPRKYCTDRGKQDRPIRVFTAVVFIFHIWVADCKMYAAVQSPTIKHS